MLALAALTLSLHLQQSTFDLLDGVAIEVAVHNTGKTPVNVRFDKPAEYEIEVQRDGQTIWGNTPQTPPQAVFPVHVRHFVAGPSVLVVYVWNAIESNGSTPGPGQYTIVARLLGENETPSASAHVHFINPVPVAAVDKFKTGDIVTIAGTLDATKGLLTDSSGTMRLARRLVTAPAGTIAVRGYLITEPDRSHAFFVQRWAPMQ